MHNGGINWTNAEVCYDLQKLKYVNNFQAHICRDGEQFVFRAALGLLALHQEHLLGEHDFILAAQFLAKYALSWFYLQDLAVFSWLDE